MDWVHHLHAWYLGLHFLRNEKCNSDQIWFIRLSVFEIVLVVLNQTSKPILWNRPDFYPDDRLYDILDSSHGQLTQTLSNPRDVCCFLSLHSPRVMMCGQSPGGGCGGRVWSSEQWTSANLGAGARKCSRARGTSGSPAPVPPPSELGWSWQQLITGLLTSLLSLNVLTTWVFF